MHRYRSDLQLSRIASNIFAEFSSFASLLRASGPALLILLGFCRVPNASAQPAKPDTPAVTGYALLDAEYYDAAPPGVAVPSSRPASLMRLLLAPTLRLSADASIPITLIVASRQTSTQVPRVGAPSFSQMVQDPSTVLTIAPRIGWAQATLGTQTPRFTPLTAGSTRIFGAGLALDPGLLHVRVVCGYAQPAVEVDTGANVRGLYRRLLLAGRVAFGDEQHTIVGVNVVRVKDDTSSIATVAGPSYTGSSAVPDSSGTVVSRSIALRNPLMPVPEEGLAGSVDARVELANGLYLNAEAAATIYTRDAEAEEVTSLGSTVGAVTTPRASSRIDAAATIAMAYDGDRWGADASASYIGPGFRTLGQPYLESDLLAAGLRAHFSAFDGLLRTTIGAGYRRDNLLELQARTGSVADASLSVTANMSEELFVSGSYSIYLTHTTAGGEVPAADERTHSVSLAPTCTINGESLIHTLSLTYAGTYASSDDAGPSRTNAVTASYGLAFVATPLSLHCSASYLGSDVGFGASTTAGATLGGTYRLLNGALAPSLSVGLSRNAVGTNAAGLGYLLRAGLRWNVTPKIALDLNGSLNDVHNGAAGAAAFRENTLRTSLTTQF